MRAAPATPSFGRDVFRADPATSELETTTDRRDGNPCRRSEDLDRRIHPPASATARERWRVRRPTAARHIGTTSTDPRRRRATAIRVPAGRLREYGARVQDAFGRMLLDALDAGAGHEIVERDDGFLGVPTMDYLAPVRRWHSVERRALRSVNGRVLDVGCGAGRVALELQARGRDVVAIDPSVGAVDVARRRGVRDVRQMRLEEC